MAGTVCCRFVVDTLRDLKASAGTRPWTPLDLALSGFAWTSVAVSMAINFALNGVLQWHLTRDRDFVGVFEPATNATATVATTATDAAVAAGVTVAAPHDAAVVSDLLACAALVSFCTTLGSLAARGKVKEGVANPVSAAAVRDSAFARLFPSIGFGHVLVRATLLTLQLLVVYYGATRLALAGLCGGGWLPVAANTGQCVAPVAVYVWARGAWTAGLALTAWLPATLGTLHEQHLPADAVQAFADRVAGVTGGATGAAGATATPVAGGDDDVVSADTRLRRNGSAPAPLRADVATGAAGSHSKAE